MEDEIPSLLPRYESIGLFIRLKNVAHMVHSITIPPELERFLSRELQSRAAAGDFIKNSGLRFSSQEGGELSFLELFFLLAVNLTRRLIILGSLNYSSSLYTITVWAAKRDLQSCAINLLWSSG